MISKFKKIDKKFIKIRILKKDDITSDYINWLNDYEVTKFTDLITKKHTLKSVLKYVQDIYKSKEIFLYGIFYRNRHIGNIKLNEISKLHKSARISYIIGNKNFWNKGIGTFIVKKIKVICRDKFRLKKLNAGVYEKNYSSKKVLLKNNFKLEGIFKSQIFFEGKRHSLLKYGCKLYK